MKIMDVKLSDPVYIPLRQMTDAINILPTAMTYTFLQIFTDEGMTGIGPAHDGALNKVLIEDLLKPCVIGENPLNTERIWEKIYWATLPQPPPTYLLMRLLAFRAASTAFLA